MACNYVYKGKTYTKAELEDYIKNNPQEFSDVSNKEKLEYSPSLLNESGLVVHPNFDPSVGLKSERYEDGTLKFAQVFIASKFKVYNKQKGQYEYINLMDFVLPGTNKIDTSKLPEELLSMFSFRIPTSSHQSGAIIEIAGFLPHSVGDLMIVPKDHTVQIGEDYDIDTRYVYQYNYIKTEDGKLKKLEYSDIEKPEKSFEEFREDFREAKDLLWNSYYESVPKLKSNVLDSKNFKTRLSNTSLRLNKERAIELAFLKDAYDNFAVDNLLHTIFQEEYELDVIPKEELATRIAALESAILPPKASKELKEQLRKEYAEMKKAIQDLYNSNETGIKEASLKYANAIDQNSNEEKVIENNIVSIYKAVFASESPDVRQLITKVLSTDFAEDSAAAIAESTNKFDPNFSIYAPELQRQIMQAGADGKLGIGVHSNAVTLNSLLQQLDDSIKLYHLDSKGNNTDYNILLGNLVFDGTLGAIKDKKGLGRQSEYLMMSQNSATDNQKLEIMSRRNENSETINVFSLMQLAGLEQDGVSIKDQNLSYPSLFISQPIIKRYVELMKKYKSSVGGHKGNIIKKVTQELFNEYGANLPENMWQIGKDKLPMKGVFNGKATLTLGENVTSKYLYDNLTSENKSDPHQWYVFKSFMKMLGASSELNKLQKFINIENGGLGVSFFDTIDLKNTLLSLDNLLISSTNSSGEHKSLTETILGDKITVPLDEEFDEEGYIYIDTTNAGKHYIKPNNHYSHKIVNSIALGYNTWKNLFPYDENVIKDITDNAIAISNINPDSKAATDLKYKVISEMKEYSLSDSRTLFPNGIDKHRDELFIDTNENQSLGKYLIELKKAGSEIFRLPYFRDIQIEVNSKDFPTLIKYSNSDVSLENNIRVYNLLEAMSTSNKLLPIQRNGKDITEADLVKDLFRYSIIADQGNGATGFRAVMPISLFSENRVDASLRSKNNMRSPRQVNVFYNGAISSVESLLKSPKNDNVIPNSSSVPIDQIKSTLELLNRNFRSGTNEDLFSMDNEGNVTINEDSPGISNSNFIRQFFQHNVEEVPEISNLKEIEKTNSIKRIDLEKGDINYFSSFGTTGKFVKFTDARGKVSLFEKVDSEVKLSISGSKELAHYKRIPVLGTHGMNEYNPTIEVSRSLVTDRNFKGSSPIFNKINISGAGMFNSQNELASVKEVVKELLTDSENNPYKPLITLLKPFLLEHKFQEIKVETGDIKGDASYNMKTNTITFSRELLERSSKDHLRKVLMEELNHFLTKNVMSKYVKFTSIKDGKLQYDIVDPSGTIPAELTALINTYNEAFKHYTNKHGQEAFVNKIKEWRDLISGPEANHITNTSGEIGEDAYRMQDIHEFVAGIFFKDSSFAKEMSKTKYMSTDKNILEKFADAVIKLFKRVLPDANKDSISANTLDAYYKFLLADSNKTAAESKRKIIDLAKTSSAVDKSTDFLDNLDKETSHSLSTAEEIDVPLEENKSNCIF